MSRKLLGVIKGTLVLHLLKYKSGARDILNEMFHSQGHLSMILQIWDADVKMIKDCK
jgi:hypothetical protein